MSREADFIARLRARTTHPAARGLADDAALLDGLIYTHDMLVEGVHYLASDPPEDVAWKLLAVNLSDLAAKGGVPHAVLMGYALTRDAAWDAAFALGLAEALGHYNVPLIGGDTVALPTQAPRVLGLTAIGKAGARTPSRSGALVGDAVYVTCTIGDAGVGLKAARGELDSPALLSAYRRPVPQLLAGQLLAPVVSAMMDVSDGLLIDAMRMAAASGIGIALDLDAVPLSSALLAVTGENRASRLAAVTAGDDYQLLFTSSLPLPVLPCAVTRIGQIVRGVGLNLYDAAGDIPQPDVLGWEH